MSTTANLNIDHEIATVTFSNPDGLTLLDANCRNSIHQALTNIESNPEIRVVVFNAVGRVFLAGADINELKGLDYESALQYAKAGQEICNRIEDLPCFTIVCIHGAVAGGGCELVLACDVRISGVTAQIGMPETSLGLVPGWGGCYRAVRELGVAKARQIILSGRLYSAVEAKSLGLVHRVVTDAQIREVTQQEIHEAMRPAPLALQHSKKLLNRFAAAEREMSLEEEAQAFARCFESDEPKEGLSSFLEKRGPHWLQFEESSSPVN